MLMGSAPCTVLQTLSHFGSVACVYAYMCTCVYAYHMHMRMYVCAYNGLNLDLFPKGYPATYNSEKASC